MKELIACEKKEICRFEKVVVACLGALKQCTAGKGKEKAFWTD